MDRGNAEGRGQAPGRRGAPLSQPRAARTAVWLQLLIGWMPVWALFVLMMLTAHGEGFLASALVALRLLVAAAVLAAAVWRLAERLAWPHPFRPRFLAAHLLAACVYSASWLLLNSVLESLVRRRLVLVVGPGIGLYLVMGVWLYVMVAGVAYATKATERAALAEATAARSQLAALRAQLNPHFLFNALHTVVQLIPSRPRRAAEAAEQLATLLRVTMEEDRDLVSLAEEWAFVERYLEIESIRFGDRLRVEVELTEQAREALLPSFAVQTLVENAVRHGAAPRIEPTTVTVRGRTSAGVLSVQVCDTGVGATQAQVEGGGGTGLGRLRDRLAALHAERARLDIATSPGAGFVATLIIPQEPE